ncbi:MAG: hypothetical protein AABY22_24940 [Nanoarchaeota archaeon]
MAINYNFYCTICGTPFTAGKKHARCCSNVCRFVLSKTMRYESIDEDGVVLETKEEKESAKEKLEKVSEVTDSKNEKSGMDRNAIRKKRALDFNIEPKEKGENSGVGKLLKRKKKKGDSSAP